MDTQRITVALADDHPVVLHGLEALIETQDDLRLVGTAATGEQAVSMVLETRPRVAVIDLRMPGFDGLEAARRILASLPDVRILIMSGSEDPTAALEAFRAGAAGFLPKDSVPGTLIEGIRTAARGEAVMHPSVLSRVVTALHGPLGESPLAPRELEVLGMVAAGNTNVHIARSLGVSVSTVKAHLSALFEKLDARDRASALAVCFRQGWLR